MALLRSVATIGGYTLLSRVLGFARDNDLRLTYSTVEHAPPVAGRISA